ncbi:hypothetical protein [Pandoravirus japonicus]|uniref:Uncharacterized protein n=1 Tax=Pandoravirus japonicus TaxID=2823154 RepID=A0A811BRW9_9VIRU|nr:hypothetical protein [Pandoravirus japonicus]
MTPFLPHPLLEERERERERVKRHVSRGTRAKGLAKEQEQGEARHPRDARERGSRGGNRRRARKRAGAARDHTRSLMVQ